MPKTKGLTYSDTGVDIDHDDNFVRRISSLVRSTYGPQVVKNEGGFAGLYRLKGVAELFQRNMTDPLLVACTDGVGTKLKMAYESGVHHTVGIDLVAMCANDLIVVGAEPLFFLDYIGGSGLTNEVRVDLVRGVAEGCRESGMALLGGETASMPGVYNEGEYDLVGTAVGIVERKRQVTGEHVNVGDVVLGIPSSGLHSNGFSLVRAALLDSKKYSLNDAPKQLGGMTLAQELLRPTLLYVQAIRHVLQHYRKKFAVGALAHITGGGLPGNIPRVLPKGLGVRIDTKSWTPPPIFDLIKKAGRIDKAEMFKTFNMGIGMVVICAPLYANVVSKRLRQRGFSSQIIGAVVKGEGAEIK